MQRLRSTWVALVGGAFLLAFSVSAAFGAPPTEEDGPRGQSVSAFVHELIFGSEPADEEQDEDGEEEVVDESADEEQEDPEDAAREVPEEFANHGECVSEAAHNQEGFEESDSENRGEWVRTHARYLCWGLEPPDAEDEEPSVDEEGDTESATAKEERKAAKEAAKAERNAAREAAKAERQAAREAAKAERRSGKGH